ncbi:MAG TPA: acetyl/propionyl-CoA carboxylase subunit alpha, partial [Thermoanaerobaculia bacterium]
VEHPITEETLGIDLVRTQFEVASGSPLPPAWRGGKLVPQRHAIELRLYAEDPNEFLPRSGTIRVWEEPGGPGIRVDAGVQEGSRVGVEYDPLLAKLVVSAPDRAAAIERARRAVSEWIVLGVETNAELLRDVLDSGDFRSGRYSTELIERLGRRARGTEPPDAAWIAAAAALEEGAAPSSASSAPTSAGEGPPDPWDAIEGWRAGA